MATSYTPGGGLSVHGRGGELLVRGKVAARIAEWEKQGRWLQFVVDGIDLYWAGYDRLSVVRLPIAKRWFRARILSGSIEAGNLFMHEIVPERREVADDE